MAKKDLFIHSIQQVEVSGSKNIPTAVFYRTGGDYLIGYDAQEATEKVWDVNQDFKVDLGRHDTKAKRHLRFPTASGESRSAYVITQDFIARVLNQTSRWLTTHQIEHSAHILIAEPLAMQAQQDADWLENYRVNLREMLSKRTSQEYPNICFDEVSFLPEPFAVFQYYRYGINHPLMAQSAKHQALILDFGGGTFDVSVIETTKQGDISESGRNSKPYGASSDQVGGFFFNRKIAEQLYRRHLLDQRERDQLKRGLKHYDKWRRNEEELQEMRDEMRAFVLNFHRTSFEVEAPKIALCKQIKNWKLDAALSEQTRMRLPTDPFVADSQSRSVPFSATEMRQVFLEAVWKEKLAPTVKLCLDRAMQDLGGQPITIVLLSGGSANIGWFEEALFEDFQARLANAQALHLPDFQEVVAKGLAVECARRFYSESGDFGSVVYNRLCLMLDVNRSDQSSDCRPRPLKPITEGLPNPDQPGVLLQSASAVQAFIGRPMRWKVTQLGALPKKLNYFFLRSSLDPDDLDNRLNFEETSVTSPKNCKFDQDLKIELTVREDGTATPRFLYHTGRTESENVHTEAKPFALDVTYTASSPNAKAYVGFDFGTSNSSVSFVESRSIKEYKKRLGESSWKELNELAYELPYPIADPVLAYLSETTNKDRLNAAARQAFEAMLALTFYSAMVDYRWYRQQVSVRDKSKVFAQLSQRSVGPLWGLLRQLFVQQGFGKKAKFSAPVAGLFQGDLYQLLDGFVNFVAQSKHDKMEMGSVDLQRPLYALANVCNQIFKKARFGFFEHLQRERFSGKIAGYFRIADGQPPFIQSCAVKVETLPPELMPYLLIASDKVALPLCPMIFWWQDAKGQLYEHGRCHLFDFAARDGSSFSFKTVGQANELIASRNDPHLGELASELAAQRSEDGPVEAVRIVAVHCEEK